MADSLWTSLDMAKSNMRRIESRLHKYLDSDKSPLPNQKSLGYVKPAFQTPSRQTTEVLVPFSSERTVGLLRSGSKSGERGFLPSNYQKHQTDTLRGLFTTPLRINQSSVDKQNGHLQRGFDPIAHQSRYSKSAEVKGPFYRTYDARLGPASQQGNMVPNIRDALIQNNTLPPRAYLEAALPMNQPYSYQQPSAKDRISAQMSRTATMAYPSQPYRDFSWQDCGQHARTAQAPNATILLGQEISRKLLSAHHTTNLMTRVNEIKDNSQFLKTKIDQANLIFNLSTAANHPLQTESSRFGSTILHNLMGSRKIARESRRSVAESLLGGKHPYLPETMSTYESKNGGAVGTQPAWTLYGTPESAGRQAHDHQGSSGYHHTQNGKVERNPRTTDRTNKAAQSGDEMGVRNASRDPSKPSTPTRPKNRDDREADDRIASHTNTARVAEEIRKHKASLKARGNRVSEIFHLKDSHKQPASTIDTMGNLQLSSQEGLLNTYGADIPLGKTDSWVNDPKRIKNSASEYSQQEFGFRLNTKSSTQEHQDDLNATQKIGISKQLMVHGSEASVPEPEMKRSRKSRLLRPAVQSAKEISGHSKDVVKHKLTPSIKQFAKSAGSTDKPKKKAKIRFADQLIQDMPRRSPVKHSTEGFVSDMHRKIDQRSSNVPKLLTGSPLRGQPVRPIAIPSFELSKLVPARDSGVNGRGQSHKKASHRSRSSGQGQIPSKREQCLVSPMESQQRLKAANLSVVSPPLSSRRGKEQITDKLLKLQRNQFIDPVANFMKAFGSR